LIITEARLLKPRVMMDLAMCVDAGVILPISAV
jgi:hypothetical protein